MEPLKTVDEEMAALNQWLLSTYNIRPSYDTTGSFFLRILFGDKSFPAKSPEELNLPLTEHFEGIGMVIMRTGFDDVSDTVIAVGAPVYQLGGHSWLKPASIGGGPANMFPIGFSIDKYGPLIFKRNQIAHGPEHRPNIVRFIDPATTPLDGGLTPTTNGPGNLSGFTPASQWYRGGILRLETVKDTGSYDYVYADMRRNYLSSRVSHYTRQYVYLRPRTVSDSDYLIVFDRAETTRPDIVKRWEINMAYNPIINGEETVVREGKWQYSNADSIAITNDIRLVP
jgi:hypothetical protein